MDEHQFKEFSGAVLSGMQEINRRLDGLQRLAELEQRISKLEEAGRDFDEAVSRWIVRLERNNFRS